MCASEGELVPRDGVRSDLRRLETLIVGVECASNRRRGVHDDDRRASRVRVDVDEAVEPHIESALFAGLPQGGCCEHFAAIDVTAREDPLSVSGFNRPTDQDKTSGHRPDDRAHRDLGVDVEDESARRADESFRLASFQESAFERVPAPRAVAVRVGFVMRMELMRHARPV